jgi:hypothetical protein
LEGTDLEGRDSLILEDELQLLRPPARISTPKINWVKRFCIIEQNGKKGLGKMKFPPP